MVLKDQEKKQINFKKVSLGDLTWIDIVEPTKEAVKYLSENYNFHPMDLEDALTPRQLTKIEEYPQYSFIIFYSQIYEKMARVSVKKQWSAFIGDTFLITIRPAELEIFNDIFRECELSEEVRQEYLTRGSGYLLYQILDRLLDAYSPVLSKLTSLLSDIETNVFNEQLEAAQDLSNLRRDVTTQRQVMFPARTLLIELEKKLKRFTKIDLTIYYSDLMDHMNKICENLDEIKEVVEIFKDADFILSSYRANRGIRAISVMLSILLCATIVFGIYIAYSNLGNSNLPIFFLLFALALIALGLTLYFFRRKHVI